MNVKPENSFLVATHQSYYRTHTSLHQALQRGMSRQVPLNAPDLRQLSSNAKPAATKASSTRLLQNRQQASPARSEHQGSAASALLCEKRHASSHVHTPEPHQAANSKRQTVDGKRIGGSRPAAQRVPHSIRPFETRSPSAAPRSSSSRAAKPRQVPADESTDGYQLT